MPQFIDAEVEVRFDQMPGPPTSFIWRDTEYRIASIQEMRRVLDFKKRWWQRRHRDYYTVRTESGESFELYFNRGPGRKYWVLYKKLDE
ncbi:MAG: hypothetical protein HY706_01630 [Candidatus Hydrogenedentes bacterium]|nr:hypothetical protein [Candidatus Hydrogenedentota bacterium]